MSFRLKTAKRIAFVSLALAVFTAPIVVWVVSEQAEQDTVAMAIDDSRRMFAHAGAEHGQTIFSAKGAQGVADSLAGGLFDIAEVYDVRGEKLAESMTRLGQAIELELPKHDKPTFLGPEYESLTLKDGRWVLRVFVPLKQEWSAQTEGRFWGYFEGVRIIPAWQVARVRQEAIIAALIVGLAALLCGLVIYPAVVHLSAENERKAREVLSSHISMMEALGRAIARRDSDTGAHNYRVACIAAKIADRMGVAGDDMQALIIGSFLHDVGKIGIPDAILLKPGGLDEQEMSIMRTHVALGGKIVSGIGWLEHAKEIVLGHHEKWDGSGYPSQLAGEKIPLGARIFAVADVFDALTSERPYKKAFDFETAIGIVKRDSGTHFDPTVVRVFLDMARPIYDQLNGLSEESCRDLLDEEVRRYFGL